MEQVKNNKTIEVIIPLNDITTIPTLQDLILQGLILELETKRLVDDFGIEFKKIYFNNIEHDLLQFLLSQGYEINMLNSLQTPYVHVLKTKLNKVFGDTEILLKDYAISVVDDVNATTKCYVEIGHYVNGGRLGYTDNEELKQWATAYGVTNVQIISRLVSDVLTEI